MAIVTQDGQSQGLDTKGGSAPKDVFSLLLKKSTMQLSQALVLKTATVDRNECRPGAKSECPIKLNAFKSGVLMQWSSMHNWLFGNHQEVVSTIG
jgi:hypothetical protein